MSKHEWEPFRAAFDLALDRLVRSLTDAQQYLALGNDFGAIDTLDNLHELHSDVEAAFRLFKNRRM
ncbi:MAG TPA: hypothetical protein VGG72_20215 [Bryobacteraceae bacterium]